MENNKKIKIENMNGIKARVDRWVTMEDALLNCPIGSKVILKNEDVVVKYCYNIFIDRRNTRVYVEELLDEVEEIQIPDYTRVVKLKGEILDKEEKKYLNAVIAPFRSKVVSIYKAKNLDKTEYIVIAFIEKDKCNIDFKYSVFFPDFKIGTMYKGMELNKEYTLKELGLEGE